MVKNHSVTTAVFIKYNYCGGGDMFPLRPVLVSAAFAVLRRSSHIPRPTTCTVFSAQNNQSFNINFLKRFCNTTMADKVVTYEDVVSFKDDPDVLLIDVREPNELQETGTIPSSINIPLGDLPNVLQNSNPEQFKAKYGRDFPTSRTELVFSCKLGGRAAKAMDAATALGFPNSKYYKGSWTDWASKQH